MRRREFLGTLVGSLAAALAADLKTPAAAALRKHLDLVLAPDGAPVALNGKAAEALTAMCFEILYGVSGDPAHRRVAMILADRVLHNMKAMPVGVLAIKEKGEAGTMGGGPPALGWYASILGYLYHRAGREADVVYLAGVLDRYPWNPGGWWPASVDVRDGRPLIPIEKPSQINKCAAMAMACGALGEYVQPLDAKVAASLRMKTAKCLTAHIIPAQESDGFWHYGGEARDPKNKDVLGYFVLSIELLIWLVHFAPSYRSATLDRAIAKAEEFAARNIAPVTDPFTGSSLSRWTTAATPAHYDIAEEPKRGFALGVALLHGGYREQAEKIIGYALDHLRYGNRGEEAAKCAHDLATIVTLL
jgi:hypothetical protein